MQIPLDLLPSTSRLFLDYVRHSSAVGSFYPEGPNLDNIEGFARRLKFDSRQREVLSDVLSAQQQRWGGSAATVRPLREGAVAVVTGQQAGLFTGPLLSIFKALTAVKLSRELTARGVPAVPVFWIASDDHDWEEISWAGILDGETRFQRIRAELENGGTAPAAWTRYPMGLESVIESCFQYLPRSEHHDATRLLVSGAYRPGRSPVECFARMMARLFDGMGLIMLDPMDPELRNSVAGVLEAVASRGEEIRAAVLERTGAIEAAGYSGQVRVDSSFTGLFVLDGRSRVPYDPARFNGLRGTDLSPNVLVRPLVQDAMLPTSAYVAGPAEVAYLAQASAIYSCLSYRMPPVFPRITATLVEPPAARILRKYDLGLRDVFGGPAHLRASAIGSRGESGIFDEVERGLVGQAERLRPLLEATDNTLGGALDNTIQKLRGQIEGLRGRFVAAETRRDQILDRQLESLSSRLFPGGQPQERTLNVTSFLARYGAQVIGLMDDGLQLDGSVHQLLEL